jgi:hypothetical protein
MDQPSIWIPALLLAHAFACLWLVKAALGHSRRAKQPARQTVNRKDVVDCAADIEEQGKRGQQQQQQLAFRMFAICWS